TRGTLVASGSPVGLPTASPLSPPSRFVLPNVPLGTNSPPFTPSIEIFAGNFFLSSTTLVTSISSVTAALSVTSISVYFIRSGAETSVATCGGCSFLGASNATAGVSSTTGTLSSISTSTMDASEGTGGKTDESDLA